MTREQLDAIRARMEACTDYRQPPEVIHLVNAAHTLLAEVERLRDAHAMAVQVSGELCEKCGWAMRFPGEKCRCELLAEVERLSAERDAAFKRGVTAMREAAANVKYSCGYCSRAALQRKIRALPDPEDK